MNIKQVSDLQYELLKTRVRFGLATLKATIQNVPVGDLTAITEANDSRVDYSESLDEYFISIVWSGVDITLWSEKVNLIGDADLKNLKTIAK